MRQTIAILLVEDDAEGARVQQKLLGGMEAETTVAEDLERARRRLHERSWDGIILDVALPDGSGLDLLEELRGAQPHAPVLVQSALSQRELPARAFLLDAHFVYKPYGKRELRTFVERVRDRRESRRHRMDGALAAFSDAQELSAAERSLLASALRGRSYAEMAAERGTTLNTVKSQLRHLLRKTGCRSLPQLTSRVWTNVLDLAPS